MIASPQAIAPVASVAQTPADRMSHLETTVSASRLHVWLQCRLKFYFRYILSLPKPPTPAMHAGSTVHQVLRFWNLARRRGKPFSVQRSKRLFSRQWAALQYGLSIDWQTGETPEWHATWGALEHYLKQTSIPANEKPAAVEVRVEADLSRHGLPTLIGIIDLVRPGGRIVDFKLVSKTPDPQQLAHSHEIQLTGYALLFRDVMGREESGLELHHLVRTKEPKLIVSALPPTSEAQHTRLFRQIESYQTGLVRRDFVPSPGFHCAGCEFFAECRNWCG